MVDLSHPIHGVSGRLNAAFHLAVPQRAIQHLVEIARTPTPDMDKTYVEAELDVITEESLQSLQALRLEIAVLSSDQTPKTTVRLVENTASRRG